MHYGRLLGVSATLALACSLFASAAASADPITMPTLSKELSQERAIVEAIPEAERTLSSKGYDGRVVALDAVFELAEDFEGYPLLGRRLLDRQAAVMLHRPIDRDVFFDLLGRYFIIVFAIGTLLCQSANGKEKGCGMERPESDR